MPTTVVHIPTNIFVYLSIMVGLLLIVKIVDAATPRSRRKRSKSVRSTKKATQPNHRTSNAVRSDAEILRTPITKLTWAEFERLFALYFRAQGYEVEESGVGGSDGGVDLVIRDKRTNERTAVQCKHWDDRRKVGPNIIRELHSARLNTSPKCLYGMLITSSDVTEQARREADDRHITYWHGGVLDMRLSKWSQWNGKQSRR